MAYSVAESASSNFNGEELKVYVDTLEKYYKGEVDKEEIDRIMNTPRYIQLKGLIRNMQRGMGANDIFVCSFDIDQLKNYDAEADEKGEWNPICYITDCFHDPDEDFNFGDRSPVIIEYIDLLIEAYDSGKRPDVFIESETQFGYNTTAVYPIVYDNKTLAFCFVEIPMSSLQSDTDNFIFQLIIIASIVTVVLLLFGIAFFVFRMIRPIESVSKEAERFNEDDEKKISDTLDKIKTHDEIQTLSRTLLELEIGINEYIDNLTKVTAEKERIGAELNVATQIQADMLPRIFPAFPERKEFDIHATMTPAKEVGGDFYDFFLIDEDHIGLVMADVSGKGVPAALFMVIAKTLIKNRAMMGGTPGEILGYANEQLCEGNEAELFVTVWFAIVEISTGKGMAANAGHEHPALKRKDGSYELIKYRHSPAVATMEGMRFREHEFELNPGDSLYVYTDGVTEATNSNNELFGEERVIEALNRNPGASPEELLANVKEDIDRFVAEAPQFDDITMLGFTYFGKND
jgi:sigma-B regulation protein RsbU (phosphoserine phosphatase)